MKVKNIYISICLALLTLVSCQQEDVYTGPCNVRFKAYVQDEVAVTRATYTNITVSDVPAFIAELFVTNGEVVSRSSLTWNGSTATSSLRLEEGDYTIYGYAPKAEGAAFALETKAMTATAIPGLSDKDAMVIRPQSLKIGQNDKEKHVALQLDHLMAKVTPRFYLNSTYAKLRKIKIKKVELWIEGGADTHTATVTYTNDNANPYSIAWSKGEPIAQQKFEVYNVAEPTWLTTTKGDQEYGYCYFCPNQSTANLKMRVIYDVYDTEEQLLRPDAEAVNTIKKLNSQRIVPGTDYKLNIQIVPTYLYVLSDNDEESLVIND